MRRLKHEVVCSQRGRSTPLSLCRKSGTLKLMARMDPKDSHIEPRRFYKNATRIVSARGLCLLTRRRECPSSGRHADIVRRRCDVRAGIQSLMGLFIPCLSPFPPSRCMIPPLSAPEHAGIFESILDGADARGELRRTFKVCCFSSIRSWVVRGFRLPRYRSNAMKYWTMSNRKCRVYEEGRLLSASIELNTQ